MEVDQETLDGLATIIKTAERLLEKGVEPAHVVAACLLPCPQDPEVHLSDKLWVCEQTGWLEVSEGTARLPQPKN